LDSCATGDAAPLQVLQPIWHDKAETALLVAISLQARAPQRCGSISPSNLDDLLAAGRDAAELTSAAFARSIGNRRLLTKCAL
jgi:hypothetical protein